MLASPTIPASPSAPAGTPFGRYRLLRELGRGGMGVVYQAWDTELGRMVALKMLLTESGAADEDIERFLREARAAARLRHPNIIQVHESGVIAGRHHLTMDFIEGESLAALRPRLALRRFLEILRDVAGALEAAHRAGIVHRDVKPGNVLVDAAGKPFLGDFGLAKEVREGTRRRLTATGAILGTPHYMAPEQAAGRGDAVGPWSDVWSLGVMLYEHVAGRVPFDGDGVIELLRAITDRDPPPLARPGTGGGRTSRRIHPDLETMTFRCLEKDPGRRYADAGELAAELGRFLDGEPILARPLSRASRILRKAVKHRRLVLPLALAALLVVGFAAFTWSARRGAASSDERRRTAERDTAKASEQEALARAREAAERARLAADEHLVQAEALLREAKSVLYRPGIPLERYREKLAELSALYEAAIGKAPEYGWIYESRGRAGLEIGDLAAAERDLTRAMELLGPERGRVAALSLGRAVMERYVTAMMAFQIDNIGRREKPEESLLRERALALLQALPAAEAMRGTKEENQAALHRAQAFVRLAAGDGPGAYTLFQEGAEQYGDEECAWFAASVASGMHQPFESWNERALHLRPRYPRALLLRARSEFVRRDLAAARRSLDEALAIDPQYAAAWANRGVVREAEGDLAGAEADVAAALRLDPGMAIAWHLRGKLRYDRGDLAGAEADFTESLRLSERNVYALEARGFARRDQGRPREAEADFNAALAIDPRYLRALVSRAKLRAAEGNAAAAAADLEAALATDPRCGPALVARAGLRNTPGNSAAVFADLDEAVRVEPGLPEAWWLRGSLKGRRGDLRGALSDLDQAILLRGGYAAAYANRAVVRAQLGDLPGCRADFDRALELNPRDPAVWCNRGDVRRATGDLAGAIADWEKGLAVAPAGWPSRAMIEATLKKVRKP
ncbi:MAG: protein kinase [Planctomycetes bacterium]|nr:protein kinase [Planctomycetota bacterium]